MWRIYDAFNALVISLAFYSSELLTGMKQVNANHSDLQKRRNKASVHVRCEHSHTAFLFLHTLLQRPTLWHVLHVDSLAGQHSSLLRLTLTRFLLLSLFWTPWRIVCLCSFVLIFIIPVASPRTLTYENTSSDCLPASLITASVRSFLSSNSRKASSSKTPDDKPVADVLLSACAEIALIRWRLQSLDESFCFFFRSLHALVE